MYSLRDKLKTNTGQEGSSKQSQKTLQNIKLIITVHSHQNKNLKISEAEFHISASHKDLVLATEPSVTILKEPKSNLPRIGMQTASLPGFIDLLLNSLTS